MSHTITVDVLCGSGQKEAFSWAVDDIEKAQDELFGVFHVLRKMKRKAKKQSNGSKNAQWTDMTIIERIDGGAIRNGGNHSDSTFNFSIPINYVSSVLDFFKAVDVD